jgi:hypothetical protein
MYDIAPMGRRRNRGLNRMMYEQYAPPFGLGGYGEAGGIGGLGGINGYGAWNLWDPSYYAFPEDVSNNVEKATRAHVEAQKECEKAKEKFDEAKKKFEECEEKVNKAEAALQWAKRIGGWN